MKLYFGNLPRDINDAKLRELVTPFGKAESGVQLANTGLAVGIAGAVTALGGLVWYLVQPSSANDTRRARSGGPQFTF